MSWTHLRDTIQTATTKHRCHYCASVIYPGEKYGARAGVCSDGFVYMKFHKECDDYAAANFSVDDYEFIDDVQFKRPMTAFDPVI